MSNSFLNAVLIPLIFGVFEWVIVFLYVYYIQFQISKLWKSVIGITLFVVIPICILLKELDMCPQLVGFNQLAANIFFAEAIGAYVLTGVLFSCCNTTLKSRGSINFVIVRNLVLKRSARFQSNCLCKN